MFKRILILSASVGNGHVTAAEALKKAFEIKGIAGEVRHEDVLKFTNPLFRRLYSNAYISLVNSMPEVLGWMYDNLDEPWKNEKRRLFFDKLNTRPFRKNAPRVRPGLDSLHAFSPVGNNLGPERQRKNDNAAGDRGH